ncbi:MAG: M48 family metallopeptidase [Acidimicrobiales bacterium]
MPPSTRSRSQRDRHRHDPEERLRRSRAAQDAAYEAARVVLERGAARRDAAWQDAARANRRRAVVVLSSPTIVGLVLLVVGVAVTPLLFVGAIWIVAWTAMAIVLWARAPASLLSAMEGLAPADAVAAGALRAVDAERLTDLTEGMCAVLGLPVPQLRVLVDDAPNALVVGRRHEDAVLVVTAGLVNLLGRIELEAVIAHELAHVKRLDILTGTLSSTTLGQLFCSLGGARSADWLLGSHREIGADLAGVATTRYPPGLIAALERLREARDTRPASLGEEVLRRTAHDWLVPLGPLDLPGVGLGADALEERLEVLREL